MKRTTVAAFLILISSAVLGEEPQRYLVATKRPFRSGAVAGVLRDVRNGNVSVTLRDVAGFQTFDGFAASLTSSEVAALQRSREVRWVEPVVERYAVAETRNPNGQTTPYGVDMLHAKDAWAGVRRGVINVAVIDTGVDFRHDELKDVWAGGHNVYNVALTAMDDSGHGTHVAGTIIAADNAIGVVGVARDVRLWGVKVLNANGSGTSETVMKGIDWVVAKKLELGGQWVINMSLGSKNGSEGEKESIARAVEAGILVVAASGNESTAAVKAAVLYPAAYDGVIAVGAVDEGANIAVFSNQGPQLDVVAPGVRVLSTVPVGTTFLTTITHENTRFVADPLDGSPSGRLTGEYVYCGLGNPTDFPEAVRGRIALIKRGGGLRFAIKVRNAVEAGAIGAVIFNDVDGTINWTLRNAEDPWSLSYKWPVSVAITRTDGELLLQKSGALDVTIQPDDYGVLSGTSMATPHVAGAAALIWSMKPHATAADVANALTMTAVDRGDSGRDHTYGAGLVDVLAAAKYLAPYAFPGPPTTGRIPGRR